MDANSSSRFVLVASTFLLACISGGCVNAQFTNLNLVNKCPFPVWPGIAPNQGQAVVAKGGFVLGSGHTKRVVAPSTWQGRVWARTGCSFNSTGTGSCVTGDCGGKVECNGGTGQPPATLAQLSLQPEGKPTYYDVSLVDGFNVGISVSGRGSHGRCSSAGCAVDVNGYCPGELQVLSSGKVVGCKSACLAFDLDRFCCRNEFNTPHKCGPNVYSRIFKKACPAAYSYAYDTPSPLFTCISSDFTITFCPSKLDSSPRLSWGDDSLNSLPQPV